MHGGTVALMAAEHARHMRVGEQPANVPALIVMFWCLLVIGYCVYQRLQEN